MAAILAVQGPFAPESSRANFTRLLGAIFLGGLVYGFCMGSWQVRPLQQLYAAIKTPLLLSFGGLFCLPSFFVMNTLLGLRNDFRPALTGILASQATMAICLASLGPVTLMMYTGVSSYPVAQFINGVFFFLASLGGHLVLSRHYRPLIQNNRNHRIALYSWLASFWFVTIQLAWLLRPFIGRPEDPTTFVRPDTWGNAYMEVWHVLKTMFE